MSDYLTHKIISAKRTPAPRYGVTAAGYTKQSGAPSEWMILLEGESRWRRVMVWQFSNAGTSFVRIKGVPHIVQNYDLEQYSKEHK